MTQLEKFIAQFDVGICAFLFWIDSKLGKIKGFLNMPIGDIVIGRWLSFQRR